MKIQQNLLTEVLFLVFHLLCFMVFNATYNNISVISWRSVLLVEETGGPSMQNNYHTITATTAAWLVWLIRREILHYNVGVKWDQGGVKFIRVETLKLSTLPL
jgi:hypothetical protein